MIGWSIVRRWTIAAIFQWSIDIEECDNLYNINTLWLLVEGYLGSEGVPLFLLIVGRVDDLSIDLEVFSGVPGGLSIYFCVVGRDGVSWGGLERVAPVAEDSSLIIWNVGRFIILCWYPIWLVDGITGTLDTSLSLLVHLLHCE